MNCINQKVLVPGTIKVHGIGLVSPDSGFSFLQHGGSGVPNWDSSFGYDCGGNIDDDPDDDDSPCIDAGDNSFIHEASDIGGGKRICGGKVDMGAYELPVAQCGGVSILNAEYDQENINDEVNYGWQDKELTLNCGDSYAISDTFWVEDSGGDSCGWGTNSAQQYGFCHIVIYFPEAKSVTFSVEGNTERQEQSYDYGRIYYTEGEVCPYDFEENESKDGFTPIVSVSGTDGGAACGNVGNGPAMMVHDASVCSDTSNSYHQQCLDAGHDPEETITLGAGIHDIWFINDTVDGRYHTGAYSSFTITITNP